MYETHYVLKRRPFAAIPDPRCLLAAGQMQAALDELVVCVEQGQGVAVVSAPAGTGKTLLCERLRLEVEDRFRVVLLPHASFMTRRALLQSILADLNHAYRRHDEQELRLELVPAIRALNPEREAMVLICDEAHMLTEDLLEELRILSDLADHGRPLVRLVLVGQPVLEETLIRPGLEALNQRIRAHVYLDSLDRAAALDYIDYRITWAGGRTTEIFTPDALDLVCRASEGVPRCINQLCDHALLLGYVAEQKPITADTIREALKDLRQLPLHWNESLLPEAPGSDVEPSHFESMTSSIEFTSDDNVETVEFGADVPEDEDMEEVIEDSVEAEFEEDVAEIEVSRVKPVVQIAESKTFMAAVPKFVLPVSKPQSPSVAVLPPGMVVEEIVSDRYAAIDGGFPMPPAMPHPITTTNAVIFSAIETSSDTPMSAQVHCTETKSDTQQQIVAEEFATVCTRLNDLLPEVVENPGWDASSLESEFKTPRSNKSIETDDWESLEAELGISVCELASEVRQELKSDTHTSVAELHEILDSTVGTSIEVGATDSVSPASQPAADGESASRPFRNLFSRLRRKQQGLL